MIRATTILNECGDTTIIWEEDRDEAMKEIIRKKMAEGVTFFIIQPRAFGFLPPKKTKLENADDAQKHRALAIPDEDFSKFIEEGKGDAIRTPEAAVTGSRVSKDPEEVAKSQSVGVKQKKGG